MNPVHRDVIAGGLAGFVVDVSLFPIDTIKTRFQSKTGFWAAGGLKHIYRGLPIVSAGSVPGSAIFFTTYEGIRRQKLANRQLSKIKDSILAPSIGEMAACLVRVPVEVVKQRAQATQNPTMSIVRQIWSQESIRGFYRGYLPTIMREIPFSLIQFPLWEYLKMKRRESANKKSLSFFESGFFGAISGAIAASTTTPIDVAKTRIMLASKTDPEANQNFIRVMKEIYRNEGVGKLFSGVYPRTFWITIGGFIYLGWLTQSLKAF